MSNGLKFQCGNEDKNQNNNMLLHGIEDFFAFLFIYDQFLLYILTLSFKKKTRKDDTHFHLCRRENCKNTETFFTYFLKSFWLNVRWLFDVTSWIWYNYTDDSRSSNISFLFSVNTRLKDKRFTLFVLMAFEMEYDWITQD